ncbi:carbohydrate esterase family 3 protein [Truncatella angustata]|uniref:Carbohydrate esterase family 3 protein n=1 Tax=Truncatella angustata TaxID=152316 RepID=A0A9P8UV11_9PEZI|nr:carbohydrate esterase family 3 protein [Truncatella angustata]KAH6658567.1 carbohydrate esterase family 3 protein [Truncatella angustata]
MESSHQTRAALAILAVACLPLFVTPQTITAFDHSDGVSPYGSGFAPDVVSIDFDNATFPNGQVPGLDRRAAQDFYLRIMSLGASITQGQESSDGNGYRKWLRSQLRWKGWKANMVGSKHHGTMADDNNEGHPGWTVGTVHGAFTESKSMMPNLVLINAGLNDYNNNMEDGAAERLKNMTDDIFNSIPGVTVILSTLLPNKDQNPCTDRISQQIRQLVESYRGSRIGLADIRPLLSLTDLVDGTHPDDGGYKVFAGVCWDAMSKLEDKILPPVAVPGVDDGASSSNKCKKVAGNSGPPVQSQLGSGHDDGNYVHSSIEHGVLTSARINKGNDPKSLTDAYPWHIFFANLVVGDPNADHDFFCLKGSSVWVSLNRGGTPPKFESIGQMNLDGYTAFDVRIADIDGDGRADFCLLQTDGTFICSRNSGQSNSPQWQGFSTLSGTRGTVFTQNKADKSGIVLGVGSGIIPAWKSAGLTHEGQQETGIQERVKFGRIFGSGRRDYIFLKEQDDYYYVMVWENTGSGGTKLKADGNFYCDMLNSGADDYVWIYQDGHVAEINVNLRLPPLWGRDLNIILTVPGPRVGIHLADWNGDGKCDVLVQNKATGALTLYQNNYSPGAATITFGAPIIVTAATCDQGWGVGTDDREMRVADIDGDGRADVLCIETNGCVTAWLNLASGLVNIGQVKFSEGWDRANMRLADVEASGRADLLHVDKYTGAVTVFKNNGRSSSGSSSFSWTNRGKLYNPINHGETMIFINQGGLYRADLVHVDPVTNKVSYVLNDHDVLTRSTNNV